MQARENIQHNVEKITRRKLLVAALLAAPITLSVLASLLVIVYTPGFALVNLAAVEHTISL